MTTNILKFTVSIPKLQNTKRENIDMTIYSSSTITTSSTTTTDVPRNLVLSLKNNLQTTAKTIKIQLQMFLLMITLNHLKHQGKIITVSLHQDSKTLKEQNQHINH